MISIKHIVITAGGTVEAIDGVRQIKNTSTGSLGACMYDALAEYIEASEQINSRFMVHYVVSETAVRPEAKKSLPLTFYPITDVRSVEAAFQTLFNNYNISYVIHSMAVSDFTKGYLIERNQLAAELSDVLEKAMTDSREKLSVEMLKELICSILEKPERALDASAKVQSRNDLILSLIKTPKLIKRIKEWCPACILVGFKLMKGVSEQELIRVASELAEKNCCDLVLANDMDKIDKDRHEGLLLRGRQVVGRYNTKKDIAAGIAQQLLSTADSESGEHI